MTRLEVANRALSTFSCSRIERRRGGWYVCWPSRKGEVSRRWSCRHGQSFYPPWSRKFPGGGTACTALSQLIRWQKDEPVLPLETWRYWATETVKLLPQAAVDDLGAGGYPEKVTCVLCGMPPKGLDWWCLDGVSGPCCSMWSGCRQRST